MKNKIIVLHKFALYFNNSLRYYYCMSIFYRLKKFLPSLLIVSFLIFVNSAFTQKWDIGQTVDIILHDFVPVEELESTTIMVHSLEDLNFIDIDFRPKVKRIQIRGHYYRDIPQKEMSLITEMLSKDFKHLEQLFIEHVQLDNVEFLKTIPNLTVLRVTDTQLVDLTPIASLKNLQVLEIYNNKIKNIAPIQGLAKLFWLDIAGNQVQSIYPVKGLKLTDFKAGDNQFIDLWPLENMVSLKWLSVFQTREGSARIKDIRPLYKLTNLTDLFLRDNEISSIWSLQNLTQLETLSLDGNKIIDIRGLKKLDRLKSLSLKDNEIWDARVVEHLRNLDYLNLDGNDELENIEDGEELYAPRKRKYEEIVTGSQNGYSYKLEEWSDQSDDYFDNDEDIY